MSELKMDAQRFNMLHTMLEENRKLIAALKTQRWEALKWGTALNIGTAAVALSFSDKLPNPDKVPKISLLLSTFLITMGAIALICSYTLRARNARRDSGRIKGKLINIEDLDPIRGEVVIPILKIRVKQTDFLYDWQDLFLFIAVIVISGIYTFWVVATR
jgi:hypothetical protein